MPICIWWTITIRERPCCLCLWLEMRLWKVSQSQEQSAQRRSIKICQQALPHYPSVIQTNTWIDLIGLLRTEIAMQNYKKIWIWATSFLIIGKYSTVLAMRMLRRMDSLVYLWRIAVPNVRLGNGDNMCLSYFYLLLFWSNKDEIMWNFMGKDEICVQRGWFSNGNVRTLLLHISSSRFCAC